ncbi:MAG: VWA domain-containing protein [Proteobacteria bacterium]|nr:VWA domain-containing protein [Pseudomonadota bacterium]
MSPALRIVAVLLLGAGLVAPEIRWGQLPVDVAILIDDSASVDRDAQRQAWAGVARRLAADLPAASRIAVTRFAANDVLEYEGDVLSASRAPDAEIPRTGALERGETNLEAALDGARAAARPGRAGAVVLVTDGGETRGDAARALRALARAGVPVHLVALPAGGRAGDAWVERVEAPTHAYAAEPVRVVGHIASAGPTRVRARLRVDGVSMDARSVAALPRLEGRNGATVEFELLFDRPGPRVVEIAIESPGDPRPENDVGATLVRVEGAPRLLYVSRDPNAFEASSLALSLPPRGWDLERVAANRFAASSEGAPAPDLLVLDDVSVHDLREQGQARIEGWVRDEGTGLLVLGGPHSFGAGGYRHSRLEALLPVTAESARPRPGAALYFLLDTSGSMARDREGRSRLGLARRALEETLRALPGGDRVGLASFDVEVRELLPLARHEDAAERLRAIALPGASGGTRLRPALEHALARLGGAEEEERIVVLLTDGFAEEQGLDNLGAALERAGVDVIALAVGADVNLATLGALTARGAGRLLRVDAVAELPRIARQELEMRRAPVERGHFAPRAVGTPPFELPQADWLPVTGYAVTRARPGARVHLETESGDPLWAAWRAGAGRVAALPAGLGPWAPWWPDWIAWPELTGGLVSVLARPPGEGPLFVVAEHGADGLAVRVDALDGASWSAAPTLEVSLRGPGGRTASRRVAPRAPGRYEAHFPATEPGLYRVRVTAGDRVALATALRSGDRELASARAGSENLRAWREAALFASGPVEAPPGRVSLRGWLAAGALVAFLAALGVESGLLAAF